MSKNKDLGRLFKEWNDLNQKVEDSFSKFDFSKVKEIRSKQKKIEDVIYEVIKENAPESYKEILPSEAGQMEVGYDIEGKTFYYVMIDPTSQDKDLVKLIAFTINEIQEVNVVKDFEIKD